MEPIVLVLDAHCTACGREVPYLNVAVRDESGQEIGVEPAKFPVEVWAKDFHDMPKNCASCGGVVVAATLPRGLAAR